MRIHVVPGGPMLVEGVPVSVLRKAGGGYSEDPIADAETVALCRCGRSAGMPMCDRTEPYGCFEEAPAEGPAPAPFGWDVPDPAGPAAVALKPDGPIRVAGPEAVTYGDEALGDRDRFSICRCGATRCQPLCDGSHKIVGFRG
jgi:CDGSH-type Zn-finger protein